MVRSVSCILVLLLSYSSSLAQFPRDTVYIAALAATKGQKYPAVILTPTGGFPLRDAFSLSKSAELMGKSSLDPKGLAAALALGNNYFGSIAQQLKTHQLPQEYQWIPLVLSGMVQDFRGPGGRAGLWQISHLTALKYGLYLGQGYDERLDAQRNTEVALRYLRDLEKAFGSKEMALMAFFNGEGAMRYAQSKMATVRLADEAAVWAFLYSHLPASTRDDLYRWNAMAAAMASPGFAFAHRHPLVTAGDTQGVPMPKPTQLKALADVLGVPMATLQTANPSLLGEIIPQGARMNLPVDKAELFTEKVERLYAYQDSLINIPKKKPVPVVPAIPIPANADKITYTVRPGDNLGQIALRHGVALSQLKAWNGLSSDRINAGQKLTIYGHANPNFKVEEKPTPPPAKVQTTEGAFFHYVVKQGDTLWSISRQFEGVSVEDIQKWNGIGERIDIGQVLKIKKP